jgi:hypothetical protein
MEMVALAVETMEPVGQLAERWDEFREPMIAWARRTSRIDPHVLHALRISMEQMGGDAVGQRLLAAAKLGVSAVLLAIPNVWYIVLVDRDPMHDDIAPLIEKGLRLLREAKSIQPFDPTVRVDHEITERLEERKSKHVEDRQKDWVGDLISNAVRPASQN